MAEKNETPKPLEPLTQPSTIDAPRTNPTKDHHSGAKPDTDDDDIGSENSSKQALASKAFA